MILHSMSNFTISLNQGLPLYLSKGRGLLFSGLTGSFNSSSPFFFNWHFHKLGIAAGLWHKTFAHDTAPFCGTAPSFVTCQLGRWTDMFLWTENFFWDVRRGKFGCLQSIQSQLPYQLDSQLYILRNHKSRLWTRRHDPMALICPSMISMNIHLAEKEENLSENINAIMIKKKRVYCQHLDIDQNNQYRAFNQQIVVEFLKLIKTNEKTQKHHAE